MKRPVLEIYAAAMMFICGVVGIVSLAVGLYSVVEINAPQLTLREGQYIRHQSNEEFRRALPHNNAAAKLPDAELTPLRERSLQTVLETERRNGFQTLLKLAVLLAVVAPAYWAHFWLAKRRRRET